MFTQRATQAQYSAVIGVALLLGACADDSGANVAGSAADASTSAVSTGVSEPTTGSSDDASTGEPDTTDDVVEVALRRLNEGQDVAEFEGARDAFVVQLTLQPGVGIDREFQGVVDFSTFAPPDPAVFIGMTQYDDLDAFAAAGEALGDSAEAGAFFSTFTPEVFTVLRPLEPDTSIDISLVANEDGNVLEVAARDLSQYEDFDPAEYANVRDTFLDLLAQQDGFVAEYQWVSALDENLVVGMTVYEDLDAYVALSMNEEFMGSPELAAFVGPYPLVAGYINTVVK